MFVTVSNSRINARFTTPSCGLFLTYRGKMNSQYSSIKEEKLKVYPAKTKMGQKLYQLIGYPLWMWRWTMFGNINVSSSCILHKSISGQYCPKKG
jgi:hypothetical protein